MSNKIYGKIVNAMQKVFPCEEPAGEETKKEILQNERLNFQLVYKNDEVETIARAKIEVIRRTCAVRTDTFGGTRSRRIPAAKIQRRLYHFRSTGTVSGCIETSWQTRRGASSLAMESVLREYRKQRRFCAGEIQDDVRFTKRGGRETFHVAVYGNRFADQGERNRCDRIKDESFYGKVKYE